MNTITRVSAEKLNHQHTEQTMQAIKLLLISHHTGLQKDLLTHYSISLNIANYYTSFAADKLKKVGHLCPKVFYICHYATLYQKLSWHQEKHNKPSMLDVNIIAEQIVLLNGVLL